MGSLRKIGPGMCLSTIITSWNSGGAQMSVLPSRAALTASLATSSLLTVSGASFTPADIRQIRADYRGDVTVLAHPECPPEVVDEADYAGSTAQMISFVAERRPKRVALITECSMSDNVAQEYADVEFVRPCNLCPHMKRNSLGAIRRALETMTNEVTVDPAVAVRARAAVDRMLEVR